MDDRERLKLYARIKAIEILVADLAAVWVKSQNFQQPRDYARKYGAKLRERTDTATIPGFPAVEADQMTAEIRDAVEKLWNQVIERFPE